MNSVAPAIQPEWRGVPLVRSLLDERGLAGHADVLQWLESLNRQHPVRVERVPFSELSGWLLRPDPLRIAHSSGRFFSIQGIRTETNYGPVPRWDQPIINQPEIGILGIVTKVRGRIRYFLMQGKAEPGNINGVQVSPTVQATYSNYNRVHGGRLPKYIEYFTGSKSCRVLVDQLQMEQGSRFFRKCNRNVIVEPDDDIEAGGEFRWMTLGQIKGLLRMNNVVNMDARSVVSCIALPSVAHKPALSDFGAAVLGSASRSAKPKHGTADILRWLCAMRSGYQCRVTTRSLDELENWRLTDRELSHCADRYFSVVGVRVEISGREVAQWAQPLLHHAGKGLNGMVTQKIDGVLHFLIRACFYPGNMEMFDLGSTVSRSDYISQFGRRDSPRFLDLFRITDSPYVRFCSVQSEEGGRFLHYQNQYLVIELPPNSISTEPEGFRWMTMAQIQDLLPRGIFNIEARNLLACLEVA